MAKLLWGRDYYKDHFAGILQEEPGAASSFTYDDAYIKAAHPPISYTLPLRSSSHMSNGGLPTVFDNLVSEGWLENVQRRLMGKRAVSRFELLLAFGNDCAGAVSVIDPAPERLSEAIYDADDLKTTAITTS